MSWQADIVLQLGHFDLNVQLAGGSGCTALIGPNGAGKTTVLRALAGAFETRVSTLQISGNLCAKTSGQVGYVPQGYGLFPHLSVCDNVGFGWLAMGVSREDRRDRAAQLLTEMGCGGLVDRSVNGLSGGEQQQVALARVLAVPPKFLLLDEPLAALDVVARQRMREWLAGSLAQTGIPTLMVTHEARDVAALSAEVIVLEAGRVVTEETPFVQAFFG
jgi:ABC-type sulfate/molybdate transport systems ATPase subunit